jgi:hypothetical protein
MVPRASARETIANRPLTALVRACSIGLGVYGANAMISGRLIRLVLVLHLTNWSPGWCACTVAATLGDSVGIATCAGHCAQSPGHGSPPRSPSHTETQGEQHARAHSYHGEHGGGGGRASSTPHNDPQRRCNCSGHYLYASRPDSADQLSTSDHLAVGLKLLSFPPNPTAIAADSRSLAFAAASQVPHRGHSARSLYAQRCLLTI